MKKIICDTNVYYQIAKGEIPSFIGNGIPIVATYNNIDEVSISHNILNNFDLLKETIQAIFNNYDSAIIQNPIEYAIKLDTPSYFSNHYDENYKSVMRYTEGIVNGELTEANFSGHDEVVEAINQRKVELQNAADIFMGSITKVKNYVKNLLKENKITKKKFWETNYIDFAQMVFKDLVRSISPTDYEISDNFDWNQIELFLHVFEQFLKDLIMSNRKVKANDWYDLFNLLYVQPDDKYWTNERYWINLIKKATMDRYLP